MKLSDIKPTLREARTSTIDFSGVDIWDEAGLGPVDITVEYEYEAASHTDHPYGEGSAREHHPAEINLVSVKTTSAAEQFDENGEVTGTLPVGTDLMKQSFWKGRDGDWLIDKIVDAVE